jgi:hypothetical protein
MPYALEELAANAAVELYFLSKGKDTRSESIQKVSETLLNLLKSAEMDPPAIKILGDAMHNLSGTDIRKMSDLYSQYQGIIDLFSKLGRLSREELCHLKDFCLALSNSVIAYRASVYGLRTQGCF